MRRGAAQAKYTVHYNRNHCEFRRDDFAQREWEYGARECRGNRGWCCARTHMPGDGARGHAGGDGMSRDVLVVGAGPAGMAAAVAAAENGCRVRVVDDNPAAGGQIWRGYAVKPGATHAVRFA